MRAAQPEVVLVMPCGYDVPAAHDWVPHSLPAGHDFVVVARSEAAEFVEREGLAGVKAELDELLAKAGSKK